MCCGRETLDDEVEMLYTARGDRGYNLDDYYDYIPPEEGGERLRLPTSESQ